MVPYSEYSQDIIYPLISAYILVVECWHMQLVPGLMVLGLRVWWFGLKDWLKGWGAACETWSNFIRRDQRHLVIRLRVWCGWGLYELGKGIFSWSGHGSPRVVMCCLDDFEVPERSLRELGSRQHIIRVRGCSYQLFISLVSAIWSGVVSVPLVEPYWDSTPYPVPDEIIRQLTLNRAIPTCEDSTRRHGAGVPLTRDRVHTLRLPLQEQGLYKALWMLRYQISIPALPLIEYASFSIVGPKRVHFGLVACRAFYLKDHMNHVIHTILT